MNSYSRKALGPSPLYLWNPTQTSVRLLTKCMHAYMHIYVCVCVCKRVVTNWDLHIIIYHHIKSHAIYQYYAYSTVKLIVTDLSMRSKQLGYLRLLRFTLCNLSVQFSIRIQSSWSFSGSWTQIFRLCWMRVLGLLIGWVYCVLFWIHAYHISRKKLGHMWWACLSPCLAQYGIVWYFKL